MLSLRQRWWSETLLDSSFLWVPPREKKIICAFPINICPNSLNFMKLAEVYPSPQNNSTCSKQSPCDAGFWEQQAEGLALKADPEVKPGDTIQRHSRPSVPHRRFTGCHKMLLSPPRPQWGESGTAAVKSLQRRRGKCNKIHFYFMEQEKHQLWQLRGLPAEFHSQGHMQGWVYSFSAPTAWDKFCTMNSYLCTESGESKD